MNFFPQQNNYTLNQNYVTKTNENINIDNIQNDYLNKKKEIIKNHEEVIKKIAK